MRTTTIEIGVLSVFVLSVSLLAIVPTARRAEIEKTLTQEQKELITSKTQDDNSRGVRIAIVDSAKAFESSTEGQKHISMRDRMSKKTQTEEIQRIRNEMVVIIIALAKEKGYSLVLDLQTSGTVAYFPPTENITDELVRRYNLSKR